jgi:squalene-associated FAD-dependent desaturase
MAQVLIVGGGLAGLACATALSDCGVTVQVLERSSRLGGRASSWIDEPTGDVVDIGPHVLHSEYRNLPALLDRLGTREQIVWQTEELITLATGSGSLTLRHRPLPPPLSLLPDFLRSPDLDRRDMLSNSRVTWRALQFRESDVPALDQCDALRFLRAAGVSERMIDWFWRFAAMAVLNVPLEHCSAAALMRVHGQLIGHRAIHFGFSAAGLAELYAEQCRRIIEKAGGKVVLNAGVCALQFGDETHTAVLADGSSVQSRYCVCAIPPQELSVLHAEFASFADFEPVPYISVYLWFDRKLTRERFWALPWKPERLNYDFYDLSNIRAGWSARPSVTASNIIYSHRAHALSDEEIVSATLRELAEYLPATRQARVQHARVHRIPMAIACPAPGIERRRPGTRSRVPHVYIAGDWTSTALPSSMESAVRSGFLAAEAVMADHGEPRSFALEPREPDGLAWLVNRLPGKRPATADRMTAAKTGA